MNTSVQNQSQQTEPANDRTASLSGGLHPIYGTRLRNWLRLLSRYGRNIHRSQWGRILITSGCALFGLPIRFYESVRYRPTVNRMKMETPVFIIGHWRSGTTNMHNHLLQDSQFGYVTFKHCLISPSLMTMDRPVRRLMANRMPETRPMDAVPAGLDEPMSEDFAMACLTEHTHYHGYYFPQSGDEIFDRTVLFDGLGDREIQTWADTYQFLLKKVTLDMQGRRLVLKNPPNTGRIRHLLKVYPDAKFIHVYRNPYEVYASTCRLMERFLHLFSFQEYDFKEIEEHVLRRYRLIMQRYFEDRELIPSKNLVEVRHEDVISDNVNVVRRIYEQLQIPGFEEMRPRLERYVDSLAGYKTNRYEFDPQTTQRIYDHWGFAIDRWGYQPVE